MSFGARIALAGFVGSVMVMVVWFVVLAMYGVMK
jgi:hypothetical protein